MWTNRVVSLQKKTKQNKQQLKMAAVFASYIKANQDAPEWQSRLHHTKISTPTTLTYLRPSPL